jgi:hypothetical protein
MSEEQYAMIFAAPSKMISAIRATGVDAQEALDEQMAEPLVYLLDSAGAGFGYSYEWDAFGPHSHELAADIADLTPENLAETDDLEGSIDNAAHRVQIAMGPSESLGLSRSSWLRLLAAVDYLQWQAGLDLTNGDRPPYVKKNFEDRAIESAKQTATDLHRPVS